MLIFKNVFSFVLTFYAYDWIIKGIKPAFIAIASIQMGICALSIPMCRDSFSFPSPFFFQSTTLGMSLWYAANFAGRCLREMEPLVLCAEWYSETFASAVIYNKPFRLFSHESMDNREWHPSNSLYFVSLTLPLYSNWKSIPDLTRHPSSNIYHLRQELWETKYKLNGYLQIWLQLEKRPDHILFEPILRDAWVYGDIVQYLSTQELRNSCFPNPRVYYSIV